MKDFAGKVAVITGAGSGIGRSMAVQLSREGAHLALGDINLENLISNRKIAPGINQGELAQGRCSRQG